MSDYMADLSNLSNLSGLNAANTAAKNGGAGKSKLEMDDYLQLMVAMFQNQSIDDTADIGDMMNNMVQMSVVEAITSVTSLIQESTALNYAASLVGKEVTVGETVNGQIIEHVGTVTGTGTLDGQQVIFLGDDCYFINSVMAVGRLPENREAIEALEEAGEAGEAVKAGPAIGAAEEAEEEAAEEAGEQELPPAEAAAGAGTEPAEELAGEELAEQGSEAAAEEAIT